MSNEYFNIEIPEFNQKYGTDWTSFETITDDNVDYLIGKTIDLYKLIDITRMSSKVVELWLNTLKIYYDDTDTLATKKLKLRYYNSQYSNKSLDEIYLDLAEGIVGTRGDIYSGFDLGAFIWDSSAWYDGSGYEDTDIRWTSLGSQFEIYIDVKTVVSAELDQIELLYSQPSMKPAFYLVYLIDSSFNILRTV